MMTKREVYLFKALYALTSLLFGVCLNFLVIYENYGIMPVLTSDDMVGYPEYRQGHYLIINSCDKIKYCYLSDSIGGRIPNTDYSAFVSIGDVIIITSWILCVYFLFKWMRLVRKEKKFLLHNNENKHLNSKGN